MATTMGFINLPRRAKEMILWREPVETLPDPLPPCELCLGTDYRRPYKDRWSGMIFSRLKTTARRGCPSCCIVDQALQRVDDIWRDWLEQEQGKRRYIPHRADPKWNDEKMRWQHIVTSYARKSLTFESDKLPALSGMARQMQRYLNNSGKNEYLAGLWRGNLLSDLCWERVKYTKHSYDPDSRIAYRAPSWFWCAVNDLVLHTRFMKPDSSNHLDFARIIEANCSPKDNDPTGAVATGHLTIEGLMIKVSLKYKRRDSGQYPKHVFEYSITDLLHIEDGPSITRDYDYSTKGPGHVPDRSEVHCLMLARRRDEPFVPVLHADDEAPVFRRIGCISFWSFNNAEHRYFDGASRKTVTIV